VIVINFVLVLLSNSNAAASSRLEHGLGFMQGWFCDVFIYNYSFCQRLLGIFGPTSGWMESAAFPNPEDMSKRVDMDSVQD